MAKFTLTSPKGKKYALNDSDEIHRGGEGRIIIIPGEPGLVAKIYHSGINPISQQQFDYLSALDKNLFVVPRELLLDKQKAIAGYTMEYLGQHYFPLSAIFNKNFCLRNNINEAFNRKIADSLIKAVMYAHQNNLVIGDLNQYNVLINLDAELRLIDTDSYETPSHVHSGMLLEDIRDYLYGGKINQKSDFFALSILLFYSFTFTHPFKGIHKKYKNLAERMISKTPVFINDPDLIPPKCYDPVNEPVLQNQFSRIYLAGERFLISLTGIEISVSKKIKPLVIDKIIEKDITLTPIIQNTTIWDIHFNSDLGYIETDELFLIYNARNKGYLNEIFKISKKDYNKLYLSSSNIFVQKGQKLYHFKNNTEVIEITNYVFPKETIVYQCADILIVIGSDVMNWLYLNDILNNSIRNKRTEVFGKGFFAINGLVQNVGGTQRIFYNTGKDIATVKLPFIIKDIYQQGNTGIISFIEKNEVKHRYIRINGLEIEIGKKDVERMYDFAHMPGKNDEGFIFEPVDNRISIIRTNDFLEVSVMDCSVISQQTKLQHSKAGIIAWEGGSVYLINKK